MKYKNIIFDLDGTLIDSSNGIVEAVNYSLSKMGDPKQSPEEIKKFIGYPLSQMYPLFSNHPVKELCSHFQEKAKSTIVSTTISLPGVESALESLISNNCKLSIASTKIRTNIDGIIEKLNWGKYFEVWCGGDEVSKVKPDPEIFLLTLKRMNADKDESIVVGDTVNDIYAAQKCDMKVVAVSSPYGDDKILKDAKPDYFIESLGELNNII
jgi:phosphoglycolate phosphatase-like HAD superfamily hydrolase